MYHELVDEVIAQRDRYSALLSRLEDAGFVVEEENRSALAEEDLQDAWNYLEERGPAGAVDFLETMFGFLFREA
jgi:hypothetical protein